MIAQPVTCKNPDCRAAETGKCIEGLGLSACPSYGGASDALLDGGAQRPSCAAPTESSPASEAELTQRRALSSGETMTVAAVRGLLRAGPCKVVALIGPSEAGKTTLIAILYHLFQSGPHAGFSFARSSTLLAFERICHHARAESRRAVPGIERTPLGTDLHFFHLGLLPCEDKQTVDLLLADRPGEIYRTVADNPSEATDFTEVERADRVLLLVDGARLVDPGSRHNTLSDVKLIMQGLVDARLLNSDHSVALVLTKLDLVETSASRDTAIAAFERCYVEFKRLFGGEVGSIDTFKVAALPTQCDYRIGLGLGHLLAYLMRKRPVPPFVSPTVPSPSRHFGSFGMKV